MESLYLLIPLSLVILGIAVAMFFWAVNSGQYDDIDREGERLLFDDDDDGEKGSEPQRDEAETGDRESRDA